ncbi:MAG TPA: hypothetical protein VGU02_11920 [Gaiellaceae bacterium]|nr:hypothetical protein [Gaiellaceae bacterium]
MLRRFLASVSFATGSRPSYDELPSLFADGARLTRTGPGGLSWTVDEFVAARWAAYDAGQLTSFEETELSAKTERFGDVAHRFSPYSKRGMTPDGPIDARGAISTQFVRTPDGWRISSMAWDDERPGVALPEPA